ncbi:MAG: VTT domain-containing protein [Nanoarchaeota archaeon]|nr:VTT domain-containing protein [Nanoarchaeota archaeon]
MFDLSGFLIWAQELVISFGYIGILFASFIGTASLFLPTYPLSALVAFAVALNLNPVVIALFAGVGSATGETVGFLFGSGSKQVLIKKHNKKIKEVEKLFEKYRAWAVIMFISFMPIVPIDLMGIVSGVIGYDIKKFYIACLVGKTLRYLLIALVVYYGISFASETFGFIY